MSIASALGYSAAVTARKISEWRESPEPFVREVFDPSVHCGNAATAVCPSAWCTATATPTPTPTPTADFDDSLDAIDQLEVGIPYVMGTFGGEPFALEEAAPLEADARAALVDALRKNAERTPQPPEGE